MLQQNKTSNLEWIDPSRQSIAFLNVHDLLDKIRDIVREVVETSAKNEALDKFYTIKQTCEMLKISESTFHRWKRDGEIRIIGKGSVVRVPEEEIQRMLLNSKR